MAVKQLRLVLPGLVSRHYNMQVDLGSPYQVTAVATQGDPSYNYWVTSYNVTYSLDGATFDTVTTNGVDVVSSIF